MDGDQARALLQAERERIERALHAHRAEQSDELSSADSADLGSDVLTEELDEGLSDDLRAELEAVERAEARLAAGTYGFSIESGDPIPDERLQALPAAERTAAEQARYDGEPG